ncbi:hypothetical protein MPL3365_30279 [Mesorhizobium plurifarium]|uniref:Uncharacterized protein n=1 Tax=Mesorhizobium plurifarium TaxID=69974 RepID=A0A090G7F7_MESPL|nr:hypothetical protein MPL3365_30279 [Mesorhizobium plurifarium]
MFASSRDFRPVHETALCKAAAVAKYAPELAASVPCLLLPGFELVPPLASMTHLAFVDG